MERSTVDAQSTLTPNYSKAAAMGFLVKTEADGTRVVE
jgi:hypothetical protein